MKEEAMSMLTRFEPYREMRRLQEEMDQLFGRWRLDYPSSPALAATYPPVNAWEDDNYVYAEAELPGLKLADLEISVSGDNELILKGTREQPALPEKAGWHRQERGFGGFERTLRLPVGVDANKVEARLENGVLTIQMAKRPEVKPRKIPVKSE
jgi:HSP20 family protein